MIGVVRTRLGVLCLALALMSCGSDESRTGQSGEAAAPGPKALHGAPTEEVQAADRSARGPVLADSVGSCPRPGKARRGGNAGRCRPLPERSDAYGRGSVRIGAPRSRYSPSRTRPRGPHRFRKEGREA
jgi:hypothetical protein